MRYLKYSKIITFGLFSLTLSFVQCNKETDFNPYPCIKGQVIDGGTKEPIDSAIVRLWIDGLNSDTLTFYTDSDGIYLTERINNWFDKNITIEASKFYGKYKNPDGYPPVRTDVSPNILNEKDSIASDTLYRNFDLKHLYSYTTLHSVIPKRLDFLEGQYISDFVIINEGSNQLYWNIGENNTEWMLIYWIEVYNSGSDINHLKRGGFVKFRVRISGLLSPGTYDSSILIITDQGNTVIPVHVVVE